MKHIKLLLTVCSLVAFAACDTDLKDNLRDCRVDVVPGEYTFQNNIISVSKGQKVNFSIEGNPQYLTFFSGEVGHRYSFANAGSIPSEDVVSSTLKFKVWSQYGVTATYTECPMLEILYSAEDAEGDGSEVFPLMCKNDFEADSILVRNFEWSTLVERSKLPAAPLNNVSKAISYSIPVKDFIDRNFVIAIAYNDDEYERTQEVEKEVVKVDGTVEIKKVIETVVQPTYYIAEMRVENQLKDGTVLTNYASSFGFTPLNLDCATEFKDQSQYDMPSDRAYGSTQTNVSGMWNLTDISTGNFAIRGSGGGQVWKKSWLVSDYIDLLRNPSPDTGVAIKGISTQMSSYEYSWDKVGTYTVTFVMRNVNYAYSEDKVQEFIVNVTE
ncbi:MAG: DUF5017 domain-containing protein [Candidatus Cryptobacteroides sp.]